MTSLANQPINIDRLKTKQEQQEIAHFIEQNPNITTIDLILFDMNGVVRGNGSTPPNSAKSWSKRICLPASVFALDICGETVEETGLGFEKGDGDRICRIVPNSLQVVPWQENSAQAIVTMYEPETNQPFFADPRHVLDLQVKKLKSKRLSSVCRG
ncbi:hypothetical protein P4S64_09505 [Vibrio sp. M60_M31a]